MKITSHLLEAYLKCPTKCWLRSTGEQATDLSCGRYDQAQEESYRTAEVDVMISRTHENEFVRSPHVDCLKAGTWRLATAVLAQTPHLESYLHAVESFPSKGRGKPAQLIPLRFVPTNKLGKDTRLLVGFDALVLAEISGREVSIGKISYGDTHTVLKVKIPAVAVEVQKRIERIAVLCSSPSPPDLLLIPHCVECEFQARCRQKALENDEMTEKERRKLHEKGIFTVTQLSYTFRPRRRPKRLHDKPEKYHHSLRALAIRQKKIHIFGNPRIEIEGTPVYLDIEGLPDSDFYYLIGVRFGSGDSVAQYSFWADRVEDERRIWSEFLGVLTNVENPVLIHYGSYETVCLRRMGERYGLPPAESPVGRALKRPVNLLSVIFAQVYFPTFSNRLKDIGHYLGAKWNGPVTSGLQSIVHRREWDKSHVPESKVALVAYNRDDCAALETITSQLIQIIREAKSRADVEFPNKPKQIASIRGVEIHNLFESLLRSAHSDYARSRIKLSPDKTTQTLPPETRKLKRRPRRRSFSTIKGRIVRVPRRRMSGRTQAKRLVEDFSTFTPRLSVQQGRMPQDGC